MALINFVSSAFPVSGFRCTSEGAMRPPLEAATDLLICCGFFGVSVVGVGVYPGSRNWGVGGWGFAYDGFRV